MERVRAQFETNVFGLVRMCQLVLPGMREQGWGKIVNVSSMGGKLTFPGGGLYHATKYAVEAISDALRFEVRGFGVDVIVIEPGLIHTAFGDTAVHGIEAATSAGGPVRRVQRAVAGATAGVYESGALGRLGGPPEAVAAKIGKALAAARPRARYTVTPSARRHDGPARAAARRGVGRRHADAVPAARPRLTVPTSVQSRARARLNRPIRGVDRGTVARDGHNPAHGPRAPRADRRRRGRRRRAAARARGG